MHLRTTPGRAALLVAVTALATALSACGTRKPVSISRANFVKQAQAACDQANFSLGGLPTGATDPAQQMGLLTQELTLYKNAFKKIQKLPEPAGDGATLKALFRKVGDANSLLDQEIAKQQSGDVQGAYGMQAQVAAAGKAANDALDAYGLVDCEES